MSANYNRIIIAGRIGQDPECKTASTGTVITEFSVAVSDYQGAGKENKTNWFRCKAFGKTAELVANPDHFKKGSGIMVEGKIDFYSFTPKDGDKAVILTSVIVDKVIFTDSKKKDSGEETAEAPAPARTTAAAPVNGKPAAKPSSRGPLPKATSVPEPQVFDGDDIPF